MLHALLRHDAQLELGAAGAKQVVGGARRAASRARGAAVVAAAAVAVASGALLAKRIEEVHA